MAWTPADDRPSRLAYWIVACAIFADTAKGTPLMTSLLLRAEGKKAASTFCERMFDVFHSMCATFVVIDKDVVRVT